MLAAALADRYRIERELGAGGMATVYLAHDVKHDRKVAVKVLRPELAAVLGAERFLNEIKVTANLQHPHILPLHDSGEADSFLYYVMPYVEGESLREKLNREKQLAIDESLEITKAVASALDYAHRHDVIHRDIKPENILLHEGQPVVADFGIALAVSAAGGTRLTETGLSLGTPQYMSPEQATGDRELDGRSDIYSLGCVLYEMLVGEPPHTGPTVQAVITKVVTEKPRPVTELRDTVPPHVAAALQKALAKLPADRCSTAGELADMLSGRVRLPEPTFDLPHPSGRSRRIIAQALPWGVAAVLAILLVVSRREPDVVATAASYYSITFPDSAPVDFVGEASGGGGQPAFAISRDGTRLVYVARVREGTLLFARDLTTDETRALPGTEGAFFPFFAPNGQWIAFFADGQLKKVSFDGTRVLPLAEAWDPYGGDWNLDDEIVISVQDGKVLKVVSAAGGSDRVVPNELVPRPVNRSNPAFLPESEWVLLTCGGPVLCVTSIRTGEVRLLTPSGPVPLSPDAEAIRGSDPFFMHPGYLVYALPLSGILAARPFERATLTPRGEAIPVVNGIRTEDLVDAAQVSSAAQGTLVYAEGGSARVGRLVWVDRLGQIDTLAFEPQMYRNILLAPDDRWLAVVITNPQGRNELWFYDLARSERFRWNEPSVEPRYAPAWRDGTVLVGTAGGQILEIRRGAGSGADTIGAADVRGLVSDSLAVVRHLATEEGGRRAITVLAPLETLGDTSFISAEGVRSLPLGGGDPVLFNVTADGEWLAYTSNESGRYEVYVLRSPFTGTPRRVSSDGGELPIWSGGGSELIYRNRRRWYVVRRDASGGFSPPEFLVRGDFLNTPGRDFAVGRDGRLLVIQSSLPETATELRVITNWSPAVRR